MERKTGTPIEKWDDVNGTKLPQELDPNTIGNVRRGLEDQIEQNDNSLDGIINNVKAQEPSERIRDNNSNGIPDEEELREEKDYNKSLLQKLHDCKPVSDERPHRVLAPELVL